MVCAVTQPRHTMKAMPTPQEDPPARTIDDLVLLARAGEPGVEDAILEECRRIVTSAARRLWSKTKSRATTFDRDDLEQVGWIHLWHLIQDEEYHVVPGGATFKQGLWSRIYYAMCAFLGEQWIARMPCSDAYMIHREARELKAQGKPVQPEDIAAMPHIQATPARVKAVLDAAKPPISFDAPAYGPDSDTTFVEKFIDDFNDMRPVERAVLSRIRREEIRQMIAEVDLSPLQRKIVEFKLNSPDISNREISRRLGLSFYKVRIAYKDMRAKLKEALLDWKERVQTVPKGVNLDPKRNVWRVFLYDRGEEIYIGCYKVFGDAVEAHKRAVAERQALQEAV